LGEERGEPRVDVEELVGKRGQPGRANGAARDDTVARPVGLDAAVAGAVGAGVDAEDPHASEASISFSEMSKFDETFCTSSWSSSSPISFTICCTGLPSSFT